MQLQVYYKCDCLVEELQPMDMSTAPPPLQQTSDDDLIMEMSTWSEDVYPRDLKRQAALR